jgi:hypothetical protein
MPFWTVDDFLDPKPESKTVPFSRLETAVGDAKTRSARRRNSVIGIWDHFDRVVYIFINGDRFDPS